MAKKIFLTARWENLIMANYTVDPQILKPLVPHGTELDYWEDRCYVSLVGFLFADTRVLGLSIPYHRNFEEFNLRFYVRYRTEEGWRRGVVFVKEIVPKRAIATIANALYGEHYIRLPMDHDISRTNESLSVRYRWKLQEEWNYISSDTDPEPYIPEPDSEAAFITEHYWGYTRVDENRTTTYQVEHPSWRLHRVRDYDLKVAIKELYGAPFVRYLDCEPASIFMAEGSEIIVRQGERVILQ